MAKNEYRPQIPSITIIARGDQYLAQLISSMHEKKTEKKNVLSSPQSPWSYPNIDLSFTARPKIDGVKAKQHVLSSKPSEVPLVKVKERIKRVPPPNFMTAMRDLHKVYEDDPRVDPSPKRLRNMSSFY
jgi:hypothetical protein